jgi:pimeloyl-ACP methyl ester carboxylesterase
MQEHIFDDRIYYRTNAWKPERLTLVIIHGASGSSSAWWPYEKIFENKYNLLTYDIRGHGMSKKYPNYEDYEVKNFIKDFEELTENLKISKFILWSSSFGTLIARGYLKSNRDKVLALIFTSTEDYQEDEFMLKIIRPFLAVVTAIVKYLPSNPKPRGHVDYSKIHNSDRSIQRNIADMRNTGFRAQFYTLKQSFRKGQEHDLDKINMPTLIIHGEKDSLVPVKNALAFSKKIKKADFVSIPNFDHDVHHNAVKIMSETIESFIEKNKKTFS